MLEPRWNHAGTTLENSLSTLENRRSTRNHAQFVKHVAMACYGCISPPFQPKGDRICLATPVEWGRGP